MSDEKPKGSGLHFTLAAGEVLEIKGTDYVLRNTGSVTATLNLCTKQYLREQQKQSFAARMTSDSGIEKALTNQWRPKK